MLIGYRRGQGSIILRVKILNSSVSTGAGLTGLSSTSSGLIISTIADTESTATAYTVAASNVETITTLGTFAAPTAGKCRFRELDSTNHKGVYEIQIADARFNVSNAKSLLVSVAGATNAAETDVVIPLRDLDPFDAVAGGLSRLDAAVSSRMATYTQPTGFLAATFPTTVSSLTAAGVRTELTTELGRIDVAVSSRLASASYTTPPTAAANASAVRTELTTELGRIDVATSTRSTLTAANVWQTDVSGYTTAGHAGTYLKGAGSSGDPWSTAIPGTYGAGTAGYILGTNLNATITSRLATSGYTAPLDAAGTRSALGLAAANLDTQLDALPTATENAAAVWNALVASYTTADTFGARLLRSRSAQAEVSVTGSYHVAADIHELQPAVIDNTHFAAGAIDSNAIAASAATEIATATLGATVEGSETLVQAVRLVRAALVGKLSGAATTTVTIRDAADSKARITTSVDADGNRLSVTTDAT